MTYTVSLSGGHGLLSTRRNATQNACEVVILIKPNNSPTIGERNLNYIKYHFWVNLPAGNIGNLQPVLWLRTSTANNLRAA